MEQLKMKDVIFISDLILRINSLSDCDLIGNKFMESIRSIVTYDAATFYTAENFIGRTEPCSINIEESTLHQWYLDHFDEDYTRWMFSLSRSMVCRESDYWTDEERENTIYYQKLYVPGNVHYAAIMALIHQETFLGCFSFYRAKDSGDFTDKDMSILDLLKDHAALAIYRATTSNDKEIADIDLERFCKEMYLTRREGEVLRQMIRGSSYEDICEELVISNNTLKSHVQNIYQKCEVKGKIQLLQKIGILK